MRRALSVAAVTALVVSACQDEATRPVAAAQTVVDSADQFMVGMEVILHEGGLKRAVVQADTAYFFNDNTRLRMHGVNAEFFTSTGASDGIMSANVAHYDTRAMHLEAFGDVILVNVEGRRLETPHLIYDQALNQMSGDSAFKLIEPGNRDVEGVGFTTTPNLTTIRIGRDLRGRAGQVGLPDR